MTLPEPMRVTLIVTEALESLDIAYLIGGSLASTVHGIGRATMDADILADLQLAHLEPIFRSLGGVFFVDEEAIRFAVSKRGSFNIIHKETMFKVDIFVQKGGEFDRSQLERRVYELIGTDPEKKAYFSSPEDIILAKLDLYRMGGGVSNRQWQDVINVMRVQGERLDMVYLQQWAASLGVEHLLDRALDEAE